VATLVHDFANDGMAASAGYAVVSDLQHGFFWGVPGYDASGLSKGDYFFDQFAKRSGGGSIGPDGVALGGGLSAAAATAEAPSDGTGVPRPAPDPSDVGGQLILRATDGVGPQ
jgi:hypothetical protein